MLSLNEFFCVLDKNAPVRYSQKYIELGDYDNSGIIVKSSDRVEKVLFSLDLSSSVIKRAKALKVDTIVTHHSAIYNPVKSLDVSGENRDILSAVKMGLNVVSMHLNLDVADGGIDDTLASKLGGKNYKILFPILEGVGYGREFKVEPVTFNEFIKNAKKELGTSKVVAYGKKNAVIKAGASFCGSGASCALKYLAGGGGADVIVSSDVPHHAIKEVVESGKCLLLLTHYSAENVGLKAYYEKIKKQTENKVECYYFSDERFL